MTDPLLPGEAPIRSESSLDRILGALEAAGRRVAKRGRQAQAQCPLHEDNDPSLSVTHKSERGGMTRLNCFSCHAGEQAILEGINLGLADRFDQPLPDSAKRYPTARGARSSGGTRRPANRLGKLPNRLTQDPPTVSHETPAKAGPVQHTPYDYTDESGVVLYQNVRHEWSVEGGGRDKTFKQRRPDSNGGWVTSRGALNGVRRVLRHLPKVLAAIAAGREVWLVEGEKDDENLQPVLGERGIATTNNSGAGSLDAELVEQLRGATVIAVVDRDRAGYERAHTVHTSVAEVAASVRTLLPAVEEPKADTTDHLNAGFGLDEFVEFRRGHVHLVNQSIALSRAVAAATACVGKAQIADQETRARLVAAIDAEQRGATVTAAKERRYAQRWATEAVQHARRASDHAEHAYTLYGRVAALLQEHGQPPVDIDNVNHQLNQAEDAQSQCQRIAGQAWQATDQSMPDDVSAELARLTPSASAAAAADADLADDTDGALAEVLPIRRGRGGGGGGAPQPGQIQWTQFFRDQNGHLGVRRYDRNSMEISPGPVLNLDARVIRVECAEGDQLDLADDEAIAADDTDRDTFRVSEQNRVVAYILTYTCPGSGEPMTLRVPADRARTCDWLADLPQMGLDYDSRMSGRARVWDAIRKCSPGAEVVTVYRTTGWRRLPDHGWTYMHAGGGVAATGQVPVSVQLQGPLARVDLPAPVDDPELLRDLFEQHSLALFDRLEPYVGAALLGATFRSVLGFTGPSLALFGVPGSFKSAAGGLAMQHFGVRWDRGLPSASMSGQGSTLNALRHALWQAKDCLFFADDFAPDQGVDIAAKFLAQVGRMHYNREEKARGHMNKDHEFEVTGHGERSRTSILLTSEIRAATVSGQERMLIIDLAKGQLNLDTIVELDRYESRFGRATVMASLLRWMAGQDVAQLRTQYVSYATTVGEQRRADGSETREAEALSHYQAGWRLLADFLSDVGALTGEEADQLVTRATNALDEAALRAKDLDAPTTLGERCRQLILSGLRTGAIHVSLVGGEAPPLPEALRLGYRRTVTGVDYKSGEEFTKADPRGDWVGVAYKSPEFGPRLHVDPTAMTRAILNIARQAQEPIAATKLVLQREMAAVGLLRTAQESTPQGVVTRFTVGVIGASGRQERLWDLDASRLFDDDLHPPAPSPRPDNTGGPTPAAAQAAEPTEQDDTVPELTDDTSITGAEPGPCSACGRVCALRIEGELIHLACWKRRDATDVDDNAGLLPTPPAALADAGTAPTEPFGQGNSTVLPGTGPAASPSSPPRTPRRRRSQDWAYSAVVIDTSGVYLPDGTVGPPLDQVNLGTVAAIGEEYRVGHPAGTGLIVLTSTLIEHLGLVPDMEAMSAPGDDGKAVPEWVVADRIKGYLADQTAVLSNDGGGWAIDGGDLGPWTRIRRGDRAFRLVLEPYVWIWDQRRDSGSPFLNLPDEADPPACWGELARRLERLSELLEIPWSTSPGITGEALFDQIQRRRGRNGGRVLEEAGPAPDEVLSNQPELEREANWARKPAKREAIAAEAIHGYDRRGSYLSSAGGIDLGFGTPSRMDPAEAQLVVEKARQERTKIPFGLWKVTLPVWDHTMPPPHPEQTRTAPIQRWVTTPRLALLLDEEEAGGAGYSVADLSIDGAWAWPDQARLLEPWYRRVRDAFLQARSDDDNPIDRAVKGVYTGYVGRMASVYTARGSRPWHHQPIWRAAIQGASAASLWRAIKKHQLTTGRIPIAIDHDEVLYLADSTDPKQDPPAADNGRLGALKSSKTLLLGDTEKRRLAEGARASDPSMWPSAGEV